MYKQCNKLFRITILMLTLITTHLNIPANKPIFMPHLHPCLTNPNKAAPCNSRYKNLKKKPQNMLQTHTCSTTKN